MPGLRIISRSNEQFRDRQEAGQLLSQQLLEYRGRNAIVLGIPRGGVAVAREIARQLEADLDIVLAHKLRTPGHPELAMGAIAETGDTMINQTIVSDLDVAPESIQTERDRQMAEIKRRSEMFRRVLPKLPVKGKTAIVTDDGVATGATTEAALWAVGHETPGRLIAAIPVGSEETIRRLAEQVDDMICLRAPHFFLAVGQFYKRFDPVEDEDVLEILREEIERKESK